MSHMCLDFDMIKVERINSLKIFPDVLFCIKLTLTLQCVSSLILGRAMYMIERVENVKYASLFRRLNQSEDCYFICKFQKI